MGDKSRLMIKLGQTNVEKIRFQNEETGEVNYVNAVKVGDTITWTTPVKLCLNMCSFDGKVVTTQEMANSILNQDYNFVRKSEALNPESETGDIELVQDYYDDTNNLYCDLYYGDTVEFANRTVVITYTTTGMTTKTSHFRTDVAGNPYSLNTDFEGYKLDATNYPEFSIDINLLPCPTPQNGQETPLSENLSSGATKVYFPLTGHNIQWSAAQLTLSKGYDTVEGKVVVWETTGTKEANVSANIPANLSVGTWNYTLVVGDAVQAEGSNEYQVEQKSIMLQGSFTIGGGNGGSDDGGGVGGGDLRPGGSVDNM